MYHLNESPQGVEAAAGAGVVYSFKRRFPKIKRCFTIAEEAPTRAFSWLKAPTGVFTFKTLLRQYAKQALTHDK